MVHSVDQDGNLTAVTDMWLEHSGFQREEVIGRNSMDFLTCFPSHHN
jgi:PAS domain S-box-containing protein